MLVIVSSSTIAWLLSSIMILLSYLFYNHESNYIKNSSYECGFQPFDDAREYFNIEFFMLGILFVIFDLEIVFLIPLCVSLKMFGIIGFVWALKFLFILIAGLAFELYKGALDW